ncbi:MAG TPA: tRNA guanosine(34) transglycosylase Tgt [Candidatus Polarisedimenticolia bacterium]
MAPFRFDVVAIDPTGARRGSLSTAHGAIETPVFMPVGTYGAVKSLSPEELTAAGARIILGNTYHLYLRPGHEVIEQLGGLHRFMGWDGPILTDSGGFQIFSLAALRRVTDDGVEFRSHLDGSLHFLSPEKAIEVQRALGSDICMVLDECPPATAPREALARAMSRTTSWAIRCKRAFAAETRESGDGGALFGIVQGGVEADLRLEHVRQIVDIGFHGYAVGGVSVGESPGDIHAIGRLLGPLLPDHAPRYMMGLGTPRDLIELMGSGFDMFDCVMPTRNARNGTLFTWSGPLHIRNEAFSRDPRPIEEGCLCYACARFSRAYLRHLYLSKEILGHRLNTIHNLSFYQSLMSAARAAIDEGRYAGWRDRALERLGRGEAA